MRIPSPQRGSWAFGPGSRTARLIAAGLVLTGAVAATVYWESAHSAQAARPPAQSQKYGGLPSWLPTSKTQVGRIVQASAAHPQLGIEGDTIAVTLPHGHVMATVVGPNVPEEGEFPVPRTTPCAFTVTFARASGTVPLDPAAFTIVDELGQLHRVKVRVQGGGSLPSRVAPGQVVTLTMSAVLPTGSGTFQWAPESAKAVVAWDFDVEID